MKNSKKKSSKFSFEKFNKTLDKKQLNVLFGGNTYSNIGYKTCLVAPTIII